MRDKELGNSYFSTIEFMFRFKDKNIWVVNFYPASCVQLSPTLVGSSSKIDFSVKILLYQFIILPYVSPSSFELGMSFILRVIALLIISECSGCFNVP